MQTYAEFWPFYLGEHRHATCRRLHLVGTGLVFGFAGIALAARDPRWLLGCPLVGYAFAWVGHFGFEKNRPATFQHPLWSLRGDFHMFFLAVTGGLGRELARLGLAAAAPAPAGARAPEGGSAEQAPAASVSEPPA